MLRKTRCLHAYFMVGAMGTGAPRVLPTKSFVVDVALLAVGGVAYVVISDMNSGLYVLR